MSLVLVTDGEQRAALAIVRSLGAAGHRCIVTAERRRSLAGGSRFTYTEVQTPSPGSDPVGFLEASRSLVASLRPRWILPVTDASLFALLGNRESLAPAGMPLPPLGTVRLVADKLWIQEQAHRRGIPVPHQSIVSTPGDLAVPPDEAFPLVVKSARSLVAIGGQWFHSPVVMAPDRSSLISVVAQVPPEAYPILLQQRIQGPGLGIFLLLWHGEVDAVFAHRRLREKPPWGGVSTLRESIAADPALVDQSVDMLRSLDWQGPAMVEYKVDAQSGSAYLMEINGRFWGSLQLAIDAGVNFPRRLIELAEGRVPGSPPSYRVGIRSRWWWGDVDHLLVRLRPTTRSSAPQDGLPSRWKTAWDILGPPKPRTRNEVFRWGDPVPFFRETLEWIRGR